MPELSKDLILRKSQPMLLRAAASTFPEASTKYEEEPWVTVGEKGAVLTAVKRQKAIDAAETLYYASPLAHRIIQEHADFVVGEGFDLTSTNKAAAKILHDFWYSPVNIIPANLYYYVQEFFLYGELLLVQKTHADGFVTLTYVPPREIYKVAQKEGIPGIPDYLTLHSNPEKKYSIISWDSSEGNGRLVGDCFYFRMQHLGSDVRGFPKLLPLVDFLRAWEAFSYNYLKKRANWDAIWWKVKLEGHTEDQIAEWLKSRRARPPAPGSVFAHNERCDWDLVQPDFSKSNIERDGNFFMNFLMGASGLTRLESSTLRHVRDQGEILDPVARGLATRQFEVRSCFSYVGTFVLQEAILAGKLADDTYDVLCQAPRLGVRDFQRASGALLRFTNALSQAEENNWISPEESAIVFRDMLARLGMIERALPPTRVPEEIKPEGKL